MVPNLLTYYIDGDRRFLQFCEEEMMKHRYPKTSEDFKCLAHNHMLVYFDVWHNDEKDQFMYKFKPRFRYRAFFRERALAFDGMRLACLADKPDLDKLYVKYYLAYLHENGKNRKGK